MSVWSNDCADKGSVSDYECVCDGPSCDSGERCIGQQCFSAVSIQNATFFRRKGCIVGRDEGSISCGSPPSHNLTVECCHGDLCNMNVTVADPERGDRIVFIEIITLTLLSLPQCRLSNISMLSHSHYHIIYLPT